MASTDVRPDRRSILLVDDDEAITDNLSAFLERSGYAVSVARDGPAALRHVRALLPDLVVLDVLMPGLDGRAVLRRLRGEGHTVPVILLTRVGESVERAMALEEGADDYLNKPFDPHELVARIRAVLRRGRPGGRSLSSFERLRSGDLVLDRTSQRAFVAGRALTLTPKATALLAFFMTHADEMLTRERLLEAVWGWTYPAGSRSVDTRVAELRRALGDDSSEPRFIETVPGSGYRFVAPVESA